MCFVDQAILDIERQSILQTMYRLFSCPLNVTFRTHRALDLVEEFGKYVQMHFIMCYLRICMHLKTKKMLINELKKIFPTLEFLTASLSMDKTIGRESIKCEIDESLVASSSGVEGDDGDIRLVFESKVTLLLIRLFGSQYDHHAEFVP